MSHPMSQIEVEEDLVACQERIEEILESYRESLELLAESEARYKSVHAGAYLRRVGPVRERDKYADHVTASELQAFLCAEAVCKYTKAALDAQYRRHDTLRTLNANLRGLVTSGM